MSDYTRFSSPILYDEYVMTSPWGKRPNPFNPAQTNSWHAGIDIGCFTSLDEPIPVVAIADGTVKRLFFERKGGGQVLLINHAGVDELEFSWYMHLVIDSPKAYGIQVGTQVVKGQVIGLMGNTGPSTGRHLHFEVWNTPTRHRDKEREIVTQFFRQTSQEVRKTKKGKSVYKGLNGGSLSADVEAKKAEAAQKVEEFGLDLRATGLESEIEPVTDDDIKASAIAFYLPQILEDRQRDKNKKDSHIYRFKTEATTSYASNLVFSKIRQDKHKKFSLLSSLEISNMVPFVEIYIIQKNDQGKENHILLPFDDYSEKIKIDNIFSDKTGRGGNIGIQSVDWKSLGTNQSNLNQVSVSIKILIQDIQEIETLRNGVSLLDLLYPAGTRNPERYDSDNFNIKLKLGWLYKQNKALANLSDKLGDDMLTETIFVSLHSHSFEFKDAGQVELQLEYIGMLESKISNYNRYDVLDLLNPEAKPAERKHKATLMLLEEIDQYEKAKDEKERLKVAERIYKNRNQFKVLSGVSIEQIPDNNGGSVVAIGTIEQKKHYTPERKSIKDGVTIPAETRIETIKQAILLDKDGTSSLSGIGAFFGFKTNAAGIDHLREKSEKAEEEFHNTYAQNLQNLLNYLTKEELVKYLAIDGETKQELKTISVYQKSSLTESQRQNIENVYKKVSPDKLKKAKDKNNPNGRTQRNYKEAIKKDELNNGITIDKQEVLNILVKETKASIDSSIIVPYTYLGEIISYYINLFFENSTDPEKLNIFLGDFSYKNGGDQAEELTAQNKGAATTKKVIQTQDAATRIQYDYQKKYASIADIPISIDSLVGWYNEHVINPGVKKLSLHSFLRSVFSNLIPANFTNNILDLGELTNRKITCSFNYLNIEKNKKIDLTTKKIDFSTYAKAKASPFYKLKSRTNIKNTKNVNLDHLLFILSSNEYEYNKLKGDYPSDTAKDIFHFYLGEDRGLIKDLKFTREDNQLLDAANIKKANNGEADTAIIRRIYQSNITLYGNTIFMPGQLIFISPTYPGARLKNLTLQRIGLGGYYRIISIENYIEDGKFETKLITKWQASGLDNYGNSYLDVRDDSETLEENTDIKITDTVEGEFRKEGAVVIVGSRQEVIGGQDPTDQTNPARIDYKRPTSQEQTLDSNTNVSTRVEKSMLFGEDIN